MKETDPGRIDFGPLDPTRDPAAFARRVATIARRARTEPRAPRLLDLLASRGRLALALAASLVLAIWLPHLGGRVDFEAESDLHPFEQLLDWSRSGGIEPADALLLRQ